MKTILPYCILFILTASAFAGETVVDSRRYSEESCSSNTTGASSWRKRSAGPEGAYYHSNFSRNAVILTNDTADFMTFFVYFGDLPGPNNVDDMVRIGARVYGVVVPPYTTSLTNQRASGYWICAKPGRWGIDLMRNRIVRS